MRNATVLQVTRLSELFAGETAARGRAVPGWNRFHSAAAFCMCDPAGVSVQLLNRLRRRMMETTKGLGYRLASYVSSKAFVWRNVTIGENAFILEHNVLQPFVTIGDGVTLWSGNHIGHRTVIEDDVFVSSHVVASGFCRIGARSFLGVNAALAPHVSVGADCFIGMGAAVTASTEPDGIYQGNPAERRSLSAKRFCRVRE